VVSELLGWP
jgi:hypothetical protein